MKIAIAADAPHADTDVAAHAGRAPYYLIFNADGSLHAAPANPVAAGGRSAGPTVVQFLADQGVGLVVAGEFGPNFLDALKEHGMRHAVETGRVADVIDRVIRR